MGCSIKRKEEEEEPSLLFDVGINRYQSISINTANRQHTNDANKLWAPNETLI